LGASFSTFRVSWVSASGVRVVSSGGGGGGG